MRIVAVGDIHGDLCHFRYILKAASLIDNRDAWIGEKSILVQMGDMIDRSPQDSQPDEAFLFLRQLQEKAYEKGGKVVRLLGNHELLILQSDYRYYEQDIINHMNQGMSPDELKKQIVCDAMEGRIVGAFSAKRWLFVHGGIRSDVRRRLLNKENVSHNTCKILETKIDSILRKAIEKEDFSHEIFTIGRDRGGFDKVGGAFWTDFESSLCRSDTHET